MDGAAGRGQVGAGRPGPGEQRRGRPARPVEAPSGPSGRTEQGGLDILGVQKRGPWQAAATPSQDRR